MHWLALDDAQRCDVALQVMRQAPVLWIWDNVEPVAGLQVAYGRALSPELTLSAGFEAGGTETGS